MTKLLAKLPIIIFFLLLVSESSSFTIVRRATLSTPNYNPILAPTSWTESQPSAISYGSSSSKLAMARDGEGPGTLTSIGILLIMVLFVGTGLLPLLDGGGKDLSIADSVVTRQDAPGKLKNFESKGDRLSRATIQEKLSSIPVFYLSEGGTMKTDIYLSYADAADAAGGASVKATSLDQVMYPLVLQRGRMRMAPPPAEVEKAEQELSDGTKKSYRLTPSKAAVAQATKEFEMDLAASDIPLFVADRLAFASSNGPQLPLFVDKSDCVLTYQRLRNGKSSLPELPSIRTTSLLETLNSMEKGTRPGVSQLAFYGTSTDVEKAAEMLQ